MDFALVFGLVLTGLVVVGAVSVVAMLANLFAWLAKIGDANDVDE
jgi:hypothetical protein